MTLSNIPVFPQTPKVGVVQFSSTSSTSAYQTLYTGGTNGTKISAIWASNSDSAEHNVQVQLQRSSVNYGGAKTNTLSSAGFSTVNAPVNILSTLNWPGLAYDNPQLAAPYLYLQSSLDSLVVFVSGTIATIGGVVNVCCIAKDF